jgi:uncharacterized protein YodC (DUF2158 family)
MVDEKPAIEPGDVVILKSGGQPMTVAAVEENSVECIWLGEDGELFRETIPSVALSAFGDEVDDLEIEDEDDNKEEEEDDDDDDDEDEDEEDEDEETDHEDADAETDKRSKSKRRSA